MTNKKGLSKAEIFQILFNGSSPVRNGKVNSISSEEAKKLTINKEKFNTVKGVILNVKISEENDKIELYEYNKVNGMNLGESLINAEISKRNLVEKEQEEEKEDSES